MSNLAWWCLYVGLALAVTACLSEGSNDDPGRPGGVGGSGGSAGFAGTGGASGGGGFGGSCDPAAPFCHPRAFCATTLTGSECRCQCGYQMEGTTCVPGGCACSLPLFFDHPSGSGTTELDCITPQVCLTRNRERGFFNAFGATQETQPDPADPAGTLWSPNICQAAIMSPLSFDAFVRAVGGTEVNNVLGRNLCLWLPEQSLFYDIEFDSWGAAGDDGFSYVREPFLSDECGSGEAICGATCECPSSLINDPGTGVCVVPE